MKFWFISSLILLWKLGQLAASLTPQLELNRNWLRKLRILRRPTVWPAGKGEMTAIFFFILKLDPRWDLLSKKRGNTRNPTALAGIIINWLLSTSSTITILRLGLSRHGFLWQCDALCCMIIIIFIISYCITQNILNKRIYFYFNPSIGLGVRGRRVFFLWWSYDYHNHTDARGWLWWLWCGRNICQLPHLTHINFPAHREEEQELHTNVKIGFQLTGLPSHLSLSVCPHSTMFYKKRKLIPGDFNNPDLFTITFFMFTLKNADKAAERLVVVDTRQFPSINK